MRNENFTFKVYFIGPLIDSNGASKNPFTCSDVFGMAYHPTVSNIIVPDNIGKFSMAPIGKPIDQTILQSVFPIANLKMHLVEEVSLIQLNLYLHWCITLVTT